MMLLRTKLELGVGLAVLVGALLLGRTWLADHDARLQAESQSKVLSQTQQQNQQQIQALSDLVRQVQSDNQKQVNALADAVKNLKTPNDQLAWVIAQLKTQQPLSIQVPKDTTQPAIVNIPQVDLPGIVAQVQECKTCQLNLSAATQQLSLKDQQIQKGNADLTLEKQNSHNWQVAAKGGTTWQRFTKAAKWLAIGVGVGAVAVCGSGHCK